MAFTKYVFNQASADANLSDVKNWLTANAGEYFDSFEIAYTGTIHFVICHLGEATLNFATNNPRIGEGYTNDESLCVKTASGATSKVGGMPYEHQAFTYTKYAIKSDHGIMLYMSDNYAIFITKSNAGTTAVYVKWVRSATDSSPVKCWHVADLINSTSINTADLTSKVEQQEMTALLPLVFPSGTYSPALFLTPYTQYKGYTGIIDVDGTKYAYDGYVALRE